MTDAQLIEILEKGSLELGTSLTKGQTEAFIIYLRELQAWNRKINLTSITGEKEIIIRHFLDSLTLARHVSGLNSLLDIGSGAGFPGLPLKIAIPSLKVTLLDTVEKKVHFMRHIIRTLGLEDAIALSGRVEAPELLERLSSSFDCVTSRAFTELKAFVALAAPYLRPKGTILAMKGPAVEEELREMGPIEGFSAPEVVHVEVPFSGRTTSIVLLRKL